MLGHISKNPNSAIWPKPTRFWLLLVNKSLCSIPLSCARSEIKETPGDRCVFATASLLLNNNISYLIYFMDERLQFITGSPDVIPRSLWISKLGITNLYLKVIRHEKLNRPKKPCDPSPEYDLGTCLDRSLITRAGCQPPWRRVTVEEYPICDDWTMFFSYDTEYWNFYNSDRKTLFKNSDCLMPCSFIEYKVNSVSNN